MRAKRFQKVNSTNGNFVVLKNPSENKIVSFLVQQIGPWETPNVSTKLLCVWDQTQATCWLFVEYKIKCVYNFNNIAQSQVIFIDIDSYFLRRKLHFYSQACLLKLTIHSSFLIILA